VQIHHRGLGAHSFAKDMISHRNLPGVQYDPSRHASSAAPTPAHAPVEAHAAPSQTQAPVGEQAGQAQPAAENQAQAAPDGQEIAQTPATTNGAGAETAAPSTYTIRAGDCLWNIAKDHLHSATRWSEIYKMNTDVIGGNPSLIHPGTQINLPGHGSEVANGTGLENGEYIVKSGDNLWNISKHFTGDGSKWGELYKANADVIGANPDLILPGQHLHVPGAETSTVAEAPAAATQQVASAGPDPTQATTADASQAAPPTSLEAAAAPPPTQSSAPADLHQAGAANQLSQAANPAPVTVAPAAVTPQAVAPTAAIAPATPHLGGPGAAAAGELHLPPIAELAQAVPPKSVVSSSLAPDLAQFMRRAK
jgi:nucleoid-associated protein YgaU